MGGFTWVRWVHSSQHCQRNRQTTLVCRLKGPTSLTPTDIELLMKRQLGSASSRMGFSDEEPQVQHFMIHNMIMRQFSETNGQLFGVKFDAAYLCLLCPWIP